MTNEEAIKIINNLLNYKPWEVEALAMAIKALEQQPCEDCISRQEVNTLVDELARAISDERCFISRGRDTATIMQDILDLPSVTPQRPKGKWIVLREEYEFMGGIINEPRGCECSNCNKVVGFKSNFCPNCGADMRGDNE